MLFKPTFCCNCGEKIDRSEWKIWTNRRFCELCETDHTFAEWTLRIFLGVCVFFSILFVFSSFVSDKKSAGDGTVRKLNNPAPIGRVADPALGIDSRQEVIGRNENAESVVRSAANLPANVSPANKPKIRTDLAEVIQNQQTPGISSIYFCGAETKKGSPCSRRVKGGGRCWQHVGQKAMLPESKLLISK